MTNESPSAEAIEELSETEIVELQKYADGLALNERIFARPAAPMHCNPAMPPFQMFASTTRALTSRRLNALLACARRVRELEKERDEARAVAEELIMATEDCQWHRVEELSEKLRSALGPGE